MVKIVERLSEICLKKEKGYLNAAEIVKEPELQELFQRLAFENKSLVANWQELLQGPSTSEVQGQTIGDIFEDWMEFESDIIGEDKNDMIHSCEVAEAHAISAYEEALENTLSEEVRRTITDHLLQMKNTVEFLNNVRQRPLI